MPESLSKIFSQFSEYWKGLEKSQKNRFYITSALITVAVIVSLVLLTKPTYMTLVRNLDQKQAAEMSAILDENKIWNELGKDGSSIIINEKDNNKAQIALAQKGYPKGGMTFEDAIEMISISTTESDKKHIWKQQQTADIAAKIKMLDNIEDATVSLALPEPTIFITEGQEQPRPTAYVMVKPKERLTQQQVEGIVMIVSRSVENLNPKDITVVDNNSNILNRDSSDEYISVVSEQEEIRLKKAAELQDRVYNHFSVERFDNFDTIRVVANPYLDFDKEKSHTKSLKNPEGMDSGAIISSETMKEKLENIVPSGVPGTDTNPETVNSPSYQMGNGENSSYDKQHSVNNYQYDETIKELEKASGVMIPEKSTMAISLWYGKRVTDDSKISDDFINQVKLAASTSTGIPISNISVSKLKLAPMETVEKPASEKIKEIIEDYGLFAVMLLLIVGLMVLTIPRKKPGEPLEEAELQPVTVEGLKFAVPESFDEPIPEISLEERSEIKKQIDKLVKQKPEAVAQLLRNWLSDDWND